MKHRTLAARGAAALLAVSVSLSLAPSVARAGGFYLLDRGTRPLGRGGAFVAGADDPGALWYNPAGLGLSGEQLLVDATLSFLDVSFTRIDGAGNTMPTVNGQSAPLPIPTIGVSFDLGLDRHFTFGVGIFAPNAALMQYPESLTVDGMPYPAPQRYSLLSMEGSVIATLALGAAWTPLPDELSIGLGLHLITGAFAARVAMSACEGAICTFPEDPDYDGVAQMTLAPIFTASAVLGVTWRPDRGPVRIGASMSTPFSLSGPASIEVRPPSAAAFDGAIVRSRAGDCASVPDEEVAASPDHGCRDTTADLNLNFPLVLRVGVELLAIENLRVEAAVVWETWSFQRDVSVQPRDVWIVDALGFLDYEVGALSIPRNMRDTVSVRLGGEYTIDRTFQIRLGGYWENGAFDDEYLSPLTIDSDKIVVAGGFSARLEGGFWADVMVGYAHLFARQVRNSQVPQTNPIRPPVPDAGPGRQPGDPVFIGNGDYSFTAPFVGVGIRWLPDWTATPAPVEEEPERSADGPASDDAEPEVPATDPSRPWYQQGAGAAAAPVDAGLAPA
ncbi:MAG: outer membrane protein transport protein, partial [Myxococcota bacterium]|nr:outer membrane protein transport protein [Myxococcota bacterium]